MKLEDCDIRVDDVYIEHHMMYPAYELVIVGTSFPRFHHWVEGQGDLHIACFNEIKKVGYKIRLDYAFIAENRFSGEDNIIDYVLHHLPPAFRDYQDNIYKVIDCLYDFFKGGYSVK